MMKPRVLMADDEQIITSVLSRELVRGGYQVDVAHDGEEAYNQLQAKRYDVAIMDVRMPKRDGVSLLRHIKSTEPDTAVILMTAFGTIFNAVEAMKMGAYDYLAKPFENDELLVKVEQALRLKAKVRGGAPDCNGVEHVGLVGQSEVMMRLRAKIQKVRNRDTTVLLTGESGTGKGVVAKEIHYTSERRDQPFVHVNCAALPPTLIESELFGHEKGAFTGATEMKRGKLELSGKGTIFLDEIATLTFPLQAKLLSVLQERQMERVGGVNTIEFKARVIAATNINLEEAIRNKEFREDLFYRLNVISIECPPLRFRKEDIKPLVLYFLAKFNSKLGTDVRDVSPDTWKVLKRYEWPGNVRELENSLESAITLSNGSVLEVEDLPLRINARLSSTGAPKTDGILALQELEAIKRALTKYNGHREKVARELGISRRTLQYKLNTFKLR
jgi:DNA-binding NtrC family response regulator